MSDEEIVLKRLKETLDVLKGKNVIGRIDFQIRDMVEDCIRVIEKQQKEIEELKTNNKILEAISLSFNEIQDRDKHWEDKIKAKMKEKEWSLENYDCTESDYKQSQAIGAWVVLQSLLEKE